MAGTCTHAVGGRAAGSINMKDHGRPPFSRSPLRRYDALLCLMVLKLALAVLRGELVG